jgi:hypothetical protein
VPRWKAATAGGQKAREFGALEQLKVNRPRNGAGADQITVVVSR